MAEESAFRGTAGTAWLLHRGWKLSAYARPFQLYADEIHAERLIVRRAYFAPIRGGYEGRPQEARSGASGTSLHITHLVSGSVRVTDLGGVIREIRSGGTFARRDGDELKLESDEPIALIQVVLDQSLLRLPTSSEGIDQFTDQEPASSIFRALVTSLFEADPDPSEATFISVQSALVSILQGLLEWDLLTDKVGITRSEAAILDRARHYIQQHATDPDLTVSDILDAVNVSRSYLFRVFARVNTTPLQYLTDLRLTRARQEIVMPGDSVRGMSHEIAQRSGFSTVRSLRSAMARASAREKGLARERSP